MAKKKPTRIGRPKANPEEAYTCRHVLNISPKLDKAVRAFAVSNGLRLTDAMRSMLTRVAKTDGFM